MRIFLLLLFLFLNYSAYGQSLINARAGSHRTGIYKITNAEAESLYTNKVEKPHSSYFHTLVDVFPSDSIYKKELPTGHFLFVKTIGGELFTELQSVNNVEMLILNNSRDLLLVFQNEKGEELQTLDPTVDGKRILFNKEYQAYRKAKTNRRGFVKAEANGHLNIFNVSRSYNNTLPARTKRRVITTFPFNHIYNTIRYVPQNIKSLIKYDYVQPPGIYNRVKRMFEEKTYQGYMVLNKPKYKPGDTVRMKAFFTTRKGRPISKKMDLKIYGYAGSNSVIKKIAEVDTYRPGAYAYDFVLSDTLKLSLDRQYNVYLEDKRGNNFPSESFQFEYYALKQSTYTLTHDNAKPENKGATLFLKGTDTNDLPLYNVQIEIIVRSKDVNMFYDNKLFVPDTLWQHKIKLDPLGETKAEIPDSVFKDVMMDYEVAAIFTNADNERQVKTENLHFNSRFIEIKHELKADSLYISARDIKEHYTLISYNQKANIIDSLFITLPYRIKIHQGVRSYHLLQGKKVLKVISLNGESDGLNVLAQRGADSLTVLVQNGRNLSFRYQLFKGNRIIANGTSTELQIHRRTSPNDRYYLALQYTWADEPQEQNYDFAFAKKPLVISMDHPTTVFPGQTVDFKIQVKDAFNKPVKNADLTAYALTKKFAASSPSLPSFERFKSRKAFNSFHPRSTTREKIKQKLDYTFWRKQLGLDSQAYYHFLYPEKGIFVEEVAAKDSITQLAPFVVNKGVIEPVYYIYFNKQLKHFYSTNSVDPYSFQSDSGKVTITLRLRDSLLTVKQFPVKHGVKTILSIDLQNLPSYVMVEKQPVQFTEAEATKLQPHFIWISRPASQSNAYLQQGNRYHLLRPIANTGNSNLELIGPIFPGAAKYKSAFEINFYMRPGRNYTFESGLIDRETFQRGFRDYLSPYQAKAVFHDQAHTEKSIETFWKSLEVKRTIAFRKYPDYQYTSKTRGSLHLKEKPTDVSRLATFVLNLNDPDEYYIYPGNQKQFTALRESLYQVVIIFADKSYLHPKPVLVQAHGRTFYNIENEGIKPRDAFSEEVIEKIESWSSKNTYVEQDRQFEMQDVRAQYYTMATDYTEYNGGHWVTGQITSTEDGSPLPGVNVILKGTVNGTVTDMDGNYRIYIPANGVLIFSFIGLVTEEVQVGGRVRTDVQMQGDVKQLSEVVVVGYGVQSMRALTSSVTTIEHALNGMIPGVQISGTPGAADSVAIRIRGITSLSGANSPLVIIDGKMMTMEDIDRSQVSEIEVLKSEEALAIYGARAANGIILISTKPGVSRAQLRQQKLPEAPQFASVEESTPGSSLRKNFSDYAFWKPRLSTDKKGEARFKVTFPDDITGWNVHVLGMASKKRTGQLDSKVQSFKPLVAQLALPNFLLVGDTSYALGKITNYSSDSLTLGKEVTINGKHTSGEFTIKNAVIDSLLLVGEGDSLTVKYQIEHKKYLDGEQRKIPVLPVGVKEAKGFFAALPNDTTFTVSFDKNLGDLTFYAEADLLNVLLDEIEEVRVYPYECNEQLASKLKLMIAGKLIRTYQNEKFEQAKDVERVIKKLCATQTKEGGWSWWGSGTPSSWITRHVIEALDAAAKAGYKTTYDRTGVISFLSEMDHIRLSPDEQLKTFIFLAGSGERVMAKALIDTLTKKEKIYNVYYKLLAQRVLQVANEKVDWEWIEKQKQQTLKGNWYWGEEQHTLWNNDVDNTLLVYQLMHARNPNDPNLYRLRNYFLEKRNKNWRNTYESARIVEVLLPGLLAQKKISSKPSLTLLAAEQTTITEFPYRREMKNTASVTITKKGDAPVYFTVYQQTWNPSPEKVEKDFVVKTTWADKRSTLKAGKPVELTVTLEVKKDAEYVMISIPIPAGCSYENKKQSRGQGEVHREYDLHETRIYCEKLRAGKYTYSIQLQPRYKGTYTLNPAKAEWMYFPVIYGREELKKVSIE